MEKVEIDRAKMLEAQDCGKQPSRPTPASGPEPESDSVALRTTNQAKPTAEYASLTSFIPAVIHQTSELETQVRSSIITPDEFRNRAFDSLPDNEASSEYHHSPLSEQGSIRLLRLMPHEDEKALIQCQLFEYPLQKLGEGTHLYEALSYVWGPKHNEQLIYIQSDDKINRRFPVRANLYAALSHLRDRFMERTIWIDAICINQKDHDEKGRQVQSMAKIFAKASRVIVWLGEAADDSDQALVDIRMAAEEQHTNSAIDETHQQTNQPAILKLLERPWFQRIWVREQTSNNMGRNY